MRAYRLERSNFLLTDNPSRDELALDTPQRNSPAEDFSSMGRNVFDILATGQTGWGQRERPRHRHFLRYVSYCPDPRPSPSLEIPELDDSYSGSDENPEVLVLDADHPVSSRRLVLNKWSSHPPDLILSFRTPSYFPYAVATISRLGFTSFRHTFTIVSPPCDTDAYTLDH